MALSYITGKLSAKPLGVNLNIPLVLTLSVLPDIDLLRSPGSEAISIIQPIYQEMLSVESRAGAANAPAASVEFLQAKLKSLNTTYERFILSLAQE